MGKSAVFVLVLAAITLGECRQLTARQRRVLISDEGERREVCIEDLGCYPNSNPGVEEAWTWASMSAAFEDNLMRDTRVSVAAEFRWWSPDSQEATVVTNYNFGEKMGDGGAYDATLDTKFVIHGFNGGDSEWQVTMKDSLIRKEHCNVFIVDWTNGASSMYPTAVANTWVVGAEVGHFILQLVNLTGLNVEKIHIIGHSLGAHISGFSGKWVKHRLGKIVGRVTGLDPAGPEFYGLIAGERLDIGDASFVDVIHTNWAEYTVAGLGLFDAVGHFDFYPNGGEEQPGCMTQSEALFAGGNTVDDFACSHMRVIDFFIESIDSESCLFMADQCTTWEDYTAGKCPQEGTLRVQMGYNAIQYKEHADPAAPKSFFLRTNAASPYCME